MGQNVMTVVNSTLPGGTHHYAVNVSNLADGVYYYQLDAEGTKSTMKMIIARQ